MKMVSLGIIGLGSSWETRYAPAVRKLGRRIKIRAVYDPVADRAKLAAPSLGAVAVQGVVALAERIDVQAVLMLDSGWQGDASLRLLYGRKKPIFLAGLHHADSGSLQQLHEQTVADGIAIIPELGRRYTPATARLQELMATRLGRPRRIVIDAISGTAETPVRVGGEMDIDCLTGLFDWCRYLVRSPAISVEARKSPAGEHLPHESRMIAVRFQDSQAEGEPTIAALHLPESPTERLNHETTPAATGWLPCEVVCEKGTATLQTATTITWSTDGEPIRESLASDRSEVEVMLDHFCRRVAGGLIPVADIADLCYGTRMAQAARDSLDTGEVIRLNGHPSG
jgi:predicted dehydrogenase